MKRRAQAGLTLIEVLASVLIMGLVVVSAGWVMSQAVTARATLQEEPLTAALLAGEIHEMALGLPREPSGQPAATSGAEVVALDTLDGARFGPPIDSNGFTSASDVEWTQAVELALVDMTDPGIDLPYAPTASHGTLLVKLMVKVGYRGQALGEFAWFLNP